MVQDFTGIGKVEPYGLKAAHTVHKYQGMRMHDIENKMFGIKEELTPEQIIERQKIRHDYNMVQGARIEDDIKKADLPLEKPLFF